MRQSKIKGSKSRAKKEKKSLFRGLILSVSVILLTASLTSIVYTQYKIVYAKKYPMLLKVVDEQKIIGLAVPVNDTITFGKVPRGASSVAKLNISNYEESPVFVTINAKGKLSGWIGLSDNNFILEKNESKEIKVTATVPANAPSGNYSGTLFVVVKRV